MEGCRPQHHACYALIEVLAWCRNELGLKDALRDIDFSPGHKDKVSQHVLSGTVLKPETIMLRV